MTPESTQPRPRSTTRTIEKLPTHVPGLDDITFGGIPAGRTTLVAGTAGSGKTMFAVQFLVNGLQRGEPAVMVTFEESPTDICRNVDSLGWDLRGYEQEGLLSFVDVSPRPDDDFLVGGSYDLGALLSRIEHAITKVGATRVTLDSLGAVFAHFEDGSTVRSELRRIAVALRILGVTTILTVERTHEYGDIARFGVEEFVADNVMILRNALDDEQRRRTVEVLKYRGTDHQKGEYPFTINADGVTVVPLSSIQLRQPSSTVRASSGSVDLDRMCGGGFFRDSIILVSGATGTGKTLLGMHFVAGGLDDDEKVLYLAFEESREQLYRNASGWGFDLQSAQDDGRLRVRTTYPETMGLEDHLLAIRRQIEEFEPDRIAIDSLSALERVGSGRALREFVIALTSEIKHRQMAGLFTNTTPILMGAMTVTETHVATITDTIILLRYAEVHGSMRRGLTVLKMRGSMHDKAIREFTIDGSGLHVGTAFHDVGGILSGSPVTIADDEVDRSGGGSSEREAGG